MIVVDETISDPRIIAEIEGWYSGAVISVRDLRPGARILDPEVPLHLRRLRRPTFVTINYRDFWKQHYLHPDYCIVCLKLSQEEALQTPSLLRKILSEPLFNTKRKRMGKLISWTKTRLSYCE